MDIYQLHVVIYTQPSLFFTVVSALTIPYDSHVMYVFMLTFHLFQKHKQCHSHVVCKCTIISMDYMKYKRSRLRRRLLAGVAKCPPWKGGGSREENTSCRNGRECYIAGARDSQNREQ